MIDNGGRLIDSAIGAEPVRASSSVIVTGSVFAPANGTMARYRLQEWLAFINTELHKTFAPMFDASSPDSVKAATVAKLAKRIDWVAQQLDTKPYTLGEQFSVSDAYLFTILSWCRGAGIDLNDWPVLAAFQKRVAARPAVREAMRVEGLIG